LSVVYFTDRNLGKQFPEILRAAGLTVERHDDHFGPSNSGRRRERKGVTQSRLAKELGSSQSRVAKMEGGDPSVSLDLLIRALLVVGATRRVIGFALARRPG
jgi:hypothetical protein